jgi:hypothetical protein
VAPGSVNQPVRHGRGAASPACAVCPGALNLLSQVGATVPMSYDSGARLPTILCWLKTAKTARTPQDRPLREYHSSGHETTTMYGRPKSPLTWEVTDPTAGAIGRGRHERRRMNG